MATDPRYVTASLEEYFVDKDTGLPLSAGIISFFRDADRTTPKDVFIISGSPPSYTFTNIGSTVTLSSFGVPQYLGANIMIYYFPFDSDGNPDLYYVTVQSATFIPQFDREGWPPNAATGTTPTSSSTIENFIPNGQFLSHTNVPFMDGNQKGQITQGITVIAPGGWTYERPNTSTAIDIVTFQRSPSWVNNPPMNPRYSVEVMCQSPNPGDTFKDLRIKFGDVNKFSSSVDQFTFAMEAANNQAGSVNVQLILIKNFGTGGSATTETVLATYSISSGAYVLKHTTFIFGDNSGKTIGLLDDDFIQLAIRFPVDTGFDLLFTDFMLVQGSVATPLFPYTTNAEFQYQAIAGNLPIPKSDGSDIGLPIIYTQTGFTYDPSEVGTIRSAFYPTPPFSYLNCDGLRYETAGYSSDGIPYARLQNVLFPTPDEEAPIFGTGPGYFVGHLTDIGAIRVSNNDRGAVTATSDGAVPTGFTFATIHTGDDYFVKSFLFNDGDKLFCQNDNFGFVDNAADATTGFTVTQTRSSQFNNSSNTPSASNFKALFTVFLNGIVPAAGSYFKFESLDNSAVMQKYFVWFKVDGAGVQPVVPGQTPIEIDILSTDSTVDIASQIAEAVSGFQMTRIITIAGSLVPPSSYFNIYSTTNAFYVWYTVDNVGTDPNIFGKIAIPVKISSTDSATVVSQKTILAINSKYFATPDLRGYILKGFNSGSTGNTIDPGPRYSTFRPRATTPPATDLGSFETDDFLDHFAVLDIPDTADPNPTQGFGVVKGRINVATPDKWTTYFVNNFPGFGAETRPWNVSVNFIIKY